MNIILMGYGRMGREVEKVLLERGHRIVSRVDPGGAGDCEAPDEAMLSRAEGVIEFALPEGIVERAALYARHGLKAVVATTGWEDRHRAVLAPFADGGALVYGSNFSVGAHLFFRLSAYAASLIDRVGEYDVALTEVHHDKKVDSPSGTALTAAEKILEKLERKTEILPGNPPGAIRPEQLHVASLRVGHVPGIHRVTLDSPADTLELSHSARSRGGFALGSVLAAEWLKERSGAYSVDECMQDFLDGSPESAEKL